MPAKRIIILDDKPGGGQAFDYVLWADVPAARQAKYANPLAVSAWDGVSAPELAAIRAGQVAERRDTLRMPQGATLAQARTTLVALWTAYQAEVNGNNQWTRYGTFYDDQGNWNAGGLS